MLTDEEIALGGYRYEDLLALRIVTNRTDLERKQIELNFPKPIKTGKSPSEALRALNGIGFDLRHSFSVAGLLASESTCAVGVAQLDSAPLGRCQRLLGALTDQAGFQFGNRGHLREEEFPHRARRDAWKVAEH